MSVIPTAEVINKNENCPPDFEIENVALDVAVNELRWPLHEFAPQPCPPKCDCVSLVRVARTCSVSGAVYHGPNGEITLHLSQMRSRTQG
jgi:hypothetical protein